MKWEQSLDLIKFQLKLTCWYNTFYQHNDTWTAGKNKHQLKNTHQQSQFLVVWQTLTPQYHSKHKLDNIFLCYPQGPELSHIEECHKHGQFVNKTWNV